MLFGWFSSIWDLSCIVIWFGCFIGEYSFVSLRQLK